MNRVIGIIACMITVFTSCKRSEEDTEPNGTVAFYTLSNDWCFPITITVGDKIGQVPFAVNEAPSGCTSNDVLNLVVPKGRQTFTVKDNGCFEGTGQMDVNGGACLKMKLIK